MNGSQQYQLHQTTSRAAMCAAESHRIARIATQNQPDFVTIAIKRAVHLITLVRQNRVSSQHPAVARVLRISAAVIGLIIVFLVVASPSYAQDMGINLTDFGASEAYHESYVQFRVGYYHQLKGEHEEAVAEFTEAVEGLPTFVEGYAARGDSYYALGDFDRAIADYTTAVELDPGFVSVLYTRGRTYDTVGQRDLAIADFENAISQMPEYPLPYRGMGDLHYAAGASTLALDFYQTYVELSPDAPDAQVMARMGELTTVLEADSL